MHNFNKLRKLLLGGTTPYYLPYYSGMYYLWNTPLYQMYNSNITPENVMSSNQLLYFDSSSNFNNTINNSFMLGGLQPQAKETPIINGNTTNGSKAQLIESIANIVGTAASVGSQYLNKDMYYGENWLKAGKVMSAFESIPVFGNAFKLARFGANAFARGISKDLDEFDYDKSMINRLGGSYSLKNLNKAKELSGKKSFGKSYKEALKLINDATNQIELLTEIDSENLSRLAMGSNTLINGLNYSNKLNGGLDFNHITIGKNGIKINLDRVKNIKFKQIININTKNIEEFELGGKIEEFNKHILENINFIPIFPKELLIEYNQKGKKIRTLELLIEHAKEENPRFVLRFSEIPRGIKFIDEDGSEREGSHYLEWVTDDRGAIIYPRIQEIENGSLKFLSSKDAYERANKNNNILIMSPEEAEIFFAEDSEYKTAYKRGWPKFFETFKQGGNIKESELVKLEETNLKNVIPEGALHKNKHHIEHTDGLTLKGIPVVDNDGDLQAEIELDEIIFTLEVTKKIEELYKIFKEGSNKEKDEAAIEAGKLLVQEILYNTDDRTGLISKCEKGGKL